MSIRTGRALVALLTLIVVARGVFWASVLTTPSPIDEMQHFDYVRSLARGDGIPTVGSDELADEVLALAKPSPTFFFRSYPYPDDKQADAWAGARPQYEGIQGPVYYGALTPFYWLGRPWGVTGSFYLVRFGSALIGALSIPIAWLLARRLVPGRPWLWVLPPLVLASINAVSAGAATVGNDVVVMTGCGLAALLLLSALDRGTVRAALVAGATAGAVLVGKTTALAIVPILLVLGARPLFEDLRQAPARAARWIVAYVSAFVAPFAAWTLWNLATYGAISAADQVEEITGALQQSYERSFAMFEAHWYSMRRGFWVGQLNDVFPAYGYTWEVVAVVAVTSALLVAIVRRDRIGWPIAWGALAYPLTFLAVAGFFLLAFERSGLILGRYGWAAVMPIAVAIALSAGTVGGRRFALPLCLVITTVALQREVEVTHVFIRVAYEREISDPGLAPGVEQSWSDGYAPANAIRIELPCRTSVIDLGLQAPPATIEVDGAGGPVGGTLETTSVAEFTRYRLEEPVVGTVTIPVSTGVAVSVPEREPAGSLVGGDGDPMLRVLCPVDDPRATRFEQLYPIGHPPLERWMLYAWPVLWLVVSALACVATTVVALVRPPTSADLDDPDTLAAG